MTRRTKADEVTGILSITLKTFSFRQTIVTMIMLTVINEAVDIIMICFTDAEIVVIMETILFSEILTDMMIFNGSWNGI